MESTCNLIRKVMSKDALGYPIATESKVTVLCNARTVSRQEFFDAGKAGLVPQYEIRINAIEYNGEDELEYNGKRYGIYRTYQADDYVSLYVEYKGGVSDE